MRADCEILDSGVLESRKSRPSRWARARQSLSDESEMLESGVLESRKSGLHHGLTTRGHPSDASQKRDRLRDKNGKRIRTRCAPSDVKRNLKRCLLDLSGKKEFVGKKMPKKLSPSDLRRNAQRLKDHLAAWRTRRNAAARSPSSPRVRSPAVVQKSGGRMLRERERMDTDQKDRWQKSPAAMKSGCMDSSPQGQMQRDVPLQAPGVLQSWIIFLVRVKILTYSWMKNTGRSPKALQTWRISHQVSMMIGIAETRGKRVPAASGSPGVRLSLGGVQKSWSPVLNRTHPSCTFLCTAGE